MPKMLSASLSNRRLITAVAIGALLVALVLLQGPNVRGVAASHKALPVLGVKASLKTVVTAPCTSAAIGATGFFPEPPGIPVTLSASAGGCGTAEYKFLVLAPGSSTWIFKAGYSTKSSYAWVTKGIQIGVWQIGVWVRAVGSTARYQSWALGTYTFGVPACTSASVESSATLTTTVDMTLSAISTGCISPLYEWRELLPGSTTWLTLQPYSSTATFHLVIDQPHGGYRFLVLAKDPRSTKSYDTYGVETFWWLG